MNFFTSVSAFKYVNYQRSDFQIIILFIRIRIFSYFIFNYASSEESSDDVLGVFFPFIFLIALSSLVGFSSWSFFFSS